MNCLLIENVGFLYKDGLENFLTKLKSINAYGVKIKARMRTQNGNLFGMTYIREGKTK